MVRFVLKSLSHSRIFIEGHSSVLDGWMCILPDCQASESEVLMC